MEELKYPQREFMISKAVMHNKHLMPYRSYEDDDIPVFQKSLKNYLAGAGICFFLMELMRCVMLFQISCFAGSILLILGTSFFRGHSNWFRLSYILSIVQAVFFFAYMLCDIFWEEQFYTFWFVPGLDLLIYVFGLLQMLCLSRGLPQVAGCMKFELVLLPLLYVLQCVLAVVLSGVLLVVCVAVCSAVSFWLLFRIFKRNISAE